MALLRKSWQELASRCLLTALLPLFVVACGSSDNGGGGGFVPADITVTVPATSASVTVDFDLTATGIGNGLIADVSIAASQGTVVIGDQTLHTIIYAKVPWESSGYNLYQGIAFTETNLFIYWLYCGIDNNSLDKIYYESTNSHELTLESASGICEQGNGTSQPSLALTERNIGVNRLVTGYTITGDDISLSSGTAGALTYTFSGATFTLYPFQTVDCSDCHDGPWWELHSIAYNSADPNICFTVLYLFPDSADTVFSSYSICLPNLDNINAALEGVWSAP